jgi:hypothetical protein
MISQSDNSAAAVHARDASPSLLMRKARPGVHHTEPRRRIGGSLRSADAPRRQRRRPIPCHSARASATGPAPRTLRPWPRPRCPSVHRRRPLGAPHSTARFQSGCPPLAPGGEVVDLHRQAQNEASALTDARTLGRIEPGDGQAPGRIDGEQVELLVVLMRGCNWCACREGRRTNWLGFRPVL